MLLQLLDDAVCDLLEVASSKSQDRGSGARQAHSQEALLRLGRHGLDNLGQTRDERLSVWLMNLILHGEVNELGIRGRLAKCNG